MNTVKVCEGVEISNIDRAELKHMHEVCNNIEAGADAILMGLNEYADNLLAAYDYEPEVPYKQLFFALKQVIDSACESEPVRDAIMVGIISKIGEVPVKEKQKEPVVKQKEIITRNKSAISKFGKTHTIREIQEHFGFESYDAAKGYVRYYKIPHVLSHAGRKSKRTSIALDANLVRSLAKDMRLCELMRTFNCSKMQMLYFCRKNNIEYRGR